MAIEFTVYNFISVPVFHSDNFTAAENFVIGVLAKEGSVYPIEKIGGFTVYYDSYGNYIGRVTKTVCRGLRDLVAETRQNNLLIDDLIEDNRYYENEKIKSEPESWFYGYAVSQVFKNDAKIQESAESIVKAGKIILVCHVRHLGFSVIQE